MTLELKIAFLDFIAAGGIRSVSQAHLDFSLYYINAKRLYDTIKLIKWCSRVQGFSLYTKKIEKLGSEESNIIQSYKSFIISCMYLQNAVACTFCKEELLMSFAACS